MSIYTRVSYTMMGILFITALSSCGGDEGKSGKVKLSIIPEKPIVITADSVDDNDNIIKAPWFSFRASMNNTSTDTVTVVALEVEVTGTDENGSTVSGKVAFTPSQFNTSIEKPDGSGATVTVDCKYTYFAQLAAGTTASDLKLYGADPDCGDPPVPTFYVGNNPKGREGSNNYRYTVKMKPLGWFGSYLLPTDRFERTQTFYTQ
jgi:hypothetical protein